MKTKAHFIVALSNHGITERRATYIAGQAFGKDKNPRQIVQAMHDDLDLRVRTDTVELRAIKAALDTWPRDDAPMPEATPRMNQT